MRLKHKRQVRTSATVNPVCEEHLSSLLGLTGASGAGLARRDVVQLVLHLRQTALHVSQLEVEGEVLVHLNLLILHQRSRGLLVALRR